MKQARRLAGVGRTAGGLARYAAAAARSRLTRTPPTIHTIEPSPFDRRVQAITWFSPSLGIRKRLHLYLPPGYTASQERYPVLYLLRGHEREWINLDEDSSRQGRNVVDVYEQLLSSGKVGPLILAFPGLTGDDGTVHGLGIDLLEPWLGPRAGGMGTGRWERYLIHDLIPFVDRHWRTLADGDHRGLAGFSLGGAIAARLAAKAPRLFRTAGAYDGTFFYATENGRSVRPDDSVLKNPLWDPAFGRPHDLAYATANSPANLVLQGDRAVLARITWMIQYGAEKLEPWGSNFYRGEHLVKALARRGIENAVPGVLAAGDHTWHTADRHMAITLPLHWQALQAPARQEQAGGSTSTSSSDLT